MKRQLVNADGKLRSQIDDAVGAVCRNVTEAFSCDRDQEFARFVRLARGSVNDVQDGFRRAMMRKYVAEIDLRAAREVIVRLYPALTSLLVHCSAPPHRRAG